MSCNSWKFKILLVIVLLINIFSCLKREHGPDFQVNNKINATNGFLFEIIENSIFHIKGAKVFRSNMLGNNLSNFTNVNSQSKIIQKDSNYFILIYGRTNSIFEANNVFSPSILYASDFKIIDTLVLFISNERMTRIDGFEERNYEVWLNVLKGNDLSETSLLNPLFKHKNSIINYAFFQNNKIIAIINKNTLQLISANKDEGFKFINFPLDFELNLFSSNITTKDNLIILSNNNETRIFELINNNLVLKSVIN